jgi:putative ABC transport system substrate-binding protein
MQAEISGKRLQLLREVVPKVSRVAVLMNPSNQSAPSMLRETQAAARALRVQLQVVEARPPSELNSAFSAMTRDRARALVVLPDVIFQDQRGRIAELAAKSRLPAIYAWREVVDAGGLMSYGASLPDLFRRAAVYADKILKGAKPADLPVEQPMRFELVINMKTAKALGLTFPQSILILTDHVIQ